MRTQVLKSRPGATPSGSLVRFLGYGLPVESFRERLEGIPSHLLRHRLSTLRYTNNLAGTNHRAGHIPAMNHGLRGSSMHCRIQPPSLNRIFLGLGFLAISIVLSAANKSAGQAPEFNIVIRHGRIVDGSGNPWYRGDLGIRDKRIVAIGDLSHAVARRTIDAGNHMSERADQSILGHDKV